MNCCRETVKMDVQPGTRLAVPRDWIQGVPERYLAGCDTRGRPGGQPYPRSQQVIHETSGLATIRMEVAAMKELVEIMARALVDNPEQLEVSEIAGSDTVVIELRPAKEDIGKIIGKKGRNVQAMRTLLNAAAGKLRKRVVLEIVDQ